MLEVFKDKFLTNDDPGNNSLTPKNFIFPLQNPFIYTFPNPHYEFL